MISHGLQNKIETILAFEVLLHLSSTSFQVLLTSPLQVLNAHVTLDSFFFQHVMSILTLVDNPIHTSWSISNDPVSLNSTSLECSDGTFHRQFHFALCVIAFCIKFPFLRCKIPEGRDSTSFHLYQFFLSNPYNCA